MGDIAYVLDMKPSVIYNFYRCLIRPKGILEMCGYLSEKNVLD